MLTDGILFANLTKLQPLSESAKCNGPFASLSKNGKRGFAWCMLRRRPLPAATENGYRTGGPQAWAEFCIAHCKRLGCFLQSLRWKLDAWRRRVDSWKAAAPGGALLLERTRRGMDFRGAFPSCESSVNWVHRTAVGVAQLVERRSVAPNVAGSIPVSHPNLPCLSKFK